VAVNDGEKGEVTILQVRAKMFFIERAEQGDVRWVERGAGMLKINVPESCVQYDDATGTPIPGSFDASGLDDEEEDDDDDVGAAAGSKADGEARGRKVARLILRQDHTHRVLLNTAILPAMDFQEKASLKAVGVLFTAFEGADAKPVSVQMRVRNPPRLPF
jgi:Ran-binding protein 3